jgi:uncharacterized protein
MTGDAALAALERAVAKLAPLWPLQHYVAVNPFVGLTEQRFDAAARTLAEAAGARMTMPRRFYAEALAAGELTTDDLVAGLRELGVEIAAEQLPALLASPGWDAKAYCRPTVADLAAAHTGEDWPRWIVDAISSWAAGYFDEGQAGWPSPWRELSPYCAWRAEASLDRGPERRGLPEFRARVAALPSTPADAARWALTRLRLGSGLGAQVDAQLHRLAMTISGWAGYARYLGWSTHNPGATLQADARARELVLIRLVWDALLLDGHPDPRVAAAWDPPRASRGASGGGDEQALTVDLGLQLGYERATQRRLLSQLPSPADPSEARERFVQAVFCIDVRSEPIRRTLETLDPGIETRGFAGFFGVAIEYLPLARTEAGPRCPVLVAPGYVIAESTAAPADAAGAVARRQRALASEGIWASFKQAAVSSFAYVEAAGLGYSVKLVSDALGLTRPVRDPNAGAAELRPRLDPDALVEPDGRALGIGLDDRIAIAEQLLRGMSLTDDFAPLVVLFGHGSSTVNNPHATALDCGACGGHAGDANARVAAAILDDPEVRAGLASRGIEIPATTRFVAGLHDTTTDALRLFDSDRLPASHHDALARLQTRMRTATTVARASRADRFTLELGLGRGPGRGREDRRAAAIDRAMLARSRDWAELRPEWGLAGCSSLILAPRQRTRGLDLGGRVFLHDYAWARDPEFRTLETLMSAPMVVASWINLQYYGSTVDNSTFGSGDKRIHNIVGTLGVLEGRGGDLRVGLPWQSVHDGERLAHAPVRLTVVIEAPIAAIDGVIARRPEVRALVEHGWLHLFALDERGLAAHRYAGEGRWHDRTQGLDGARFNQTSTWPDRSQLDPGSTWPDQVTAD